MKKLFPLTALALVLAASPLHATDENVIKASLGGAPAGHQTDFRVKFGTMTVGKVTFGVAVDEKDYVFTGDGNTQGLAEWFAPGKAEIRSEGSIADHQVTARSHFLSVTEAKKKTVLKMAFSGGTVDQVVLEPDERKKKKPKKYVMIEPGDLENVVDPASTLVVPVALEKARDPDAVCGHVFRVYDGDTRFDIRLSHKRTAKVKTSGYDGYAHVCKLKYVPVAGHRRKHDSTERMSKNDDMEIWLAPTGAIQDDVAVFTPIRIVVPTWLGTFSAEADYFGPSRS